MLVLNLTTNIRLGCKFSSYSSSEFLKIMLTKKLCYHEKDKNARIIFKTLHFLHANKLANKLVCYVTLDWKGLPVTNMLDYWAYS